MKKLESEWRNTEPMTKYATDLSSHRNWTLEKQRTKPFMDQTLYVTKMTEEQLEQYKREKEAYLLANPKPYRKRVAK